jgi:hypothetical protein
MLRISPIPFNSQEALADGVETSARAVHLVPAWQRMGQVMLRISTEQNVVSLAIALEGRIAGPWVAALSQTWQESAPSLGKRELLIDLRNTTDADAIGIRLLREIYSQTAARFLTGNPWTKYLAEEIIRG